MGVLSRSTASLHRDAPVDAPAVSVVEQVPVVSLTGDVDLLAVDAVTAAIRAACLLADRGLVVDLSGVDFVDVVGVHALERAHSACFAEGVSVVLAGARPTVARMLRLVQGPHGSLLPMLGTVAEGVAAVEPPRRLLTG